MKTTLLILSLVCVFVFTGCAGLSKYCDKTQAIYIKANAAAKAAHEGGLIPEDKWQNCVIPLDHTANDAIVACYRAAASQSAVDVIQALAATAQLFVNDFADLKGCK